MDEATIQRLLITQVLENFPRLAREAALSNAEFRRRQDLAITVGVKLGEDGPSFPRDNLYDALREAIDGADGTADLLDDADRTWTVHVVPQTADEPVFTIEHGDRRIRIEDHSALARDKTTRIAWLVRTASAFLPPPDWITRRRAELETNVPTDEAFVDLMEDIEAMPARLDAALRADLSRGGAASHLFVPNTRSYYDRLVGAASPGMTVAAYIDDVVGPMIEGMVLNHGARGLRYALLCCSHARISAFLPLSKVERRSLLELYEWIAARGDPISRVGAAEAALNHLHTLPELEPYIDRIVDALVEDEDGDSGPYAVLSTLIALTGADLARLRILPGVPPFYRRQAAIAQASLVFRAFADVMEDSAGIMRWSDGTGYKEVAFLQALIDLRREPRYLPEYVLPAQLRAEILGRLRIAGVEHEATITSSSLRHRMIGSDCTLARVTPWPRAFLPGPLEGTAEAITPLPDELRATAREALGAAQLDAQSFSAAIEIAYISGDVDETAALASDALRRVSYLVDTDRDASGSFATIMGLAILASAARSHDLAKAVRILVRIKRRQGAFRDDPENEVRIALIAAAAFSEIGDWSEFIGGSITETAFALENHARAGILLRMLRRLRLLEPALLRHVAQAEAALSAFQRQ